MSAPPPRPRAPVGPRGVAAEVLVRVEKDGAFAAAALDAALDRHASLDRRDRALATELAYGVLRLKSYLEARVRRHAPKGTGSLDPSAMRSTHASRSSSVSGAVGRR